MKSVNSKNHSFIVPLVFGLSDYEKEQPLYFWIFEVYLNFAIRNNSPIIAQENYFIKEINYLNKTYSYSIDNEKKKILYNNKKKAFLKYSIKNSETEKIIGDQKERYKAETDLFTKRNQYYEKILEDKINKIEDDYNRKIDAIVVWIWNPSLEAIAKKKGIRIISQELSSIRNNYNNTNYNTTLCYFQFYNKYDKYYCEKLYKEFLNLIKYENLQIFSRDELLSLFLNSDDLIYLRESKKAPSYEIGISPGFENDAFFESYSNEKIEETCKKIDNLFNPESVSIRCHPNLERDIGNTLWAKDNSAKSIYWVSRCKRILTSVSNIAFDAMLFGKTSYVLSNNMPFAFKSINKIDWIDDFVVDSLYLNFMLFGYFTHWNLILDPKYINWRLSNPSIIDIYKFNRNYVLDILGIDKTNTRLTQQQILEQVHMLNNEEIKKLTEYNSQSEIREERDLVIAKDLELKKIYSSISWKLTQPIRELLKTVKDFRNKISNSSLKEKPTSSKFRRYIKYVLSIKTKKEFLRYFEFAKYYLLEKITKEEKVSVVIPIWNRTKELKESINSILNQTYKNIELILVTDGSPKETIEVIKKYEDNPRVKIFYYYDNSGNAVRGRNKGIREATGKYFAFQDSDDIADKNRIKNSIEYIKNFNVDGVYGGWRAKLDGTRKITGLENNQEVLSPDCDIEMMKEICVPCQSTVMMKTQILKELGGLKPSMKYREDHELWLRFLNNGYKFKAIPKVLTNLRLHKGNAELLFKKDDKLWYGELEKTYKKNTLFKPKIAYIIPSVGVSGGIAVIIQHANRLIKRGYDVFLISEDDYTEITWMQCDAQVVPLHTPNSYYFNNIDLLIATGWSTAQYLHSIPSERKLYFVQSDERRFFDKKEKDLVKFIEDTYKMDCEYFTEAKWIQRWLKEEFNHNAYYVPNGLDEEIFYRTRPFKKDKNRLRILLEGPISVWFKGLTDAYYSVKDIDADIWIVSGNGTPPTLWRYDKFFERVPIERMKYLYSSCDILLKMSRVEGFFGPPMEAMACGCIPVVSKVTGYDEYIKDGENALVIEAGDTEGAKKAIEKLINNKALQNNLIKNGYKTVKEWNWDKSIDLLEDVINKKKIKKFYDDKSLKYSYKEFLESY